MTLRTPRAGIGVSRRLSERDRQRRAAEAPASPDTGPAAAQAGTGVLGGMVEALQNLMAQLSRAAEAAAGEHDPAAPAGPHAGGGSFSLGGGGGRAVFGYTLRMGLDGVRAEPFGDVPDGAAPDSAAPASPTERAPAASPARQPIVDVFEEPGAVVVIAELPGADAAGLVCRVEGDGLLIEAAGARRYRKRVALPVAVRPDALHRSFQNGILEVRLVPA